MTRDTLQRIGQSPVWKALVAFFKWFWKFFWFLWAISE